MLRAVTSTLEHVVWSSMKVTVHSSNTPLVGSPRFVLLPVAFVVLSTMIICFAISTGVSESCWWLGNILIEDSFDFTVHVLCCCRLFDSLDNFSIFAANRCYFSSMAKDPI